MLIEKIRLITVETVRQTNRWVLEPTKLKTCLGAKMTQVKLSDFWHIVRRQGSLEEATVLGE